MQEFAYKLKSCGSLTFAETNCCELSLANPLRISKDIGPTLDM